MISIYVIWMQFAEFHQPFLLIYFFINFSISGCFVTLLKLSCFDKLFWATPLELIEHYNIWYETWAKSGASPNFRATDPDKYIQFFNWVPNWFNKYFFTKGSDVLSGILSICIVFFIFLKSKIVTKNTNKYFSLYIFIILFFFIWFYFFLFYFFQYHLTFSILIL